MLLQRELVPCQHMRVAPNTEWWLDWCLTVQAPKPRSIAEPTNCFSLNRNFRVLELKRETRLLAFRGTSSLAGVYTGRHIDTYCHIGTPLNCADQISFPTVHQRARHLSQQLLRSSAIMALLQYRAPVDYEAQQEAFRDFLQNFKSSQ